MSSLRLVICVRALLKKAYTAFARLNASAMGGGVACACIEDTEGKRAADELRARDRELTRRRYMPSERCSTSVLRAPSGLRGTKGGELSAMRNNGKTPSPSRLSLLLAYSHPGQRSQRVDLWRLLSEMFTHRYRSPRELPYCRTASPNET